MPKDQNRYMIETIKAYGKSLMGFIRKQVKSDADAEDILQDVWYQFSNVINVQPIEQTSSWLYRVAKNKILDKHKKHGESLLDDLYRVDHAEDTTENLLSILMIEVTTPETAYLRNLFWEQLFLALDELPEEQKQVFIWQELEDLSFDEISERTGVKFNTLVSRKRYAVLHLRKRLKQLYKEIIEY
ncbi:RNA polymerase sigma factor (sigma-70 family) [Pedobacter metabolipauper]|uniref:RNA polymerase sigma factor (Sigma-70 family) n=2 Tax=Pedobacter metabolipauper TaxID=425513 RepID=A0A4V3D1M8_9SPHI|nr:RNA polymerase sigma factor (sigma-70 family) [Pedobacter metabolipauper]